MSAHPVLDATDKAIAAASHLTDMDAGAVEALRTLAMRIDTDDDLREAYLEARGADAKPLQLDNVSIPTYLKYCESLGLTPAGREGKARAPKPAAPVSKLAKLRAVKTG